MVGMAKKTIHFSWGEAKQPISARRERVEPWRKGLFFFDAFDTLERCLGLSKQQGPDT